MEIKQKKMKHLLLNSSWLRAQSEALMFLVKLGGLIVLVGIVLGALLKI